MFRSALLGLLALGCGSPAPAPTPPEPPPPPAPEPPRDLPALQTKPGTRCGEVAANLPDLLGGALFLRLDDTDYAERHDDPTWASSHLAASGEFPAEYDENDTRWSDWDEFHLAEKEWACAYAPGRAWDGDTATAWCEGAQGPGVGEILIVPLGKAEEVQIATGYQKSEELRTANGRPERVRVTVLEAREVRAEPTQMGTVRALGPIAVLGKEEVTLKDEAAPQPLPLPSMGRSPGREVLVAIEILSVYPGSKFEDTCISEVTPATVED